MTLRFLLAMTLLTTSMPVTAIPQAPAVLDTFEREVAKALNACQEAKRGVVIHVNGEAISGIVKAVGPALNIPSFMHPRRPHHPLV